MARRPLTQRDGQAAGRRTVARECRNLTIEGLRGFSAAAVICYHVHNMAIKGEYFHPNHSPIVNSLVRSLGRFGVLMFFMISGYLIVQSLVKYDSIPRFLKHRVWRIYPVFTPLHLIMFTLGPWQGYEWMGALKHSLPQYALQFFSNLLLLPGIFRLPIAQRNAWSLSYEFAFYVISCLLFFAATRRAHRGWRLLSLGTGLAASVGVLRYHPIAVYFLIGVALFLSDDAVARHRAARCVPAFAGLLFLALAFFTYAQGWLLASLILSLPFFFTVVHQTGWLARFLQTRPLLGLGTISYSLYLIHPFVLDAARAVVRSLAPRLPSDALALALFAILGVGGAIVAATILYRSVEVGFTSRLRRRKRPAPNGRRGRVGGPRAGMEGDQWR